jgi:hypothetical protein
MSSEDLELHGHSDIFSLVETKVVLGQVQQPIMNFTGHGDNFMVHGVNIPFDYGKKLTLVCIVNSANINSVNSVGFVSESAPFGSICCE